MRSLSGEGEGYPEECGSMPLEADRRRTVIFLVRALIELRPDIGLPTQRAVTRQPLPHGLDREQICTDHGSLVITRFHNNYLFRT
jgi:hypothetical protein